MREVILCQRQLKIRSVFSLNDCFLFSPPHPVKKFFYRCDRRFHLDDLLKLYEVHDNYAIVLISGKRTEFYLHNVNQTKFLKGLDESLPNQHKTGGQSAPRFGRIRDEKIGWYVKKIAELMVKMYITPRGFVHKGLILAGPAEIKDLIRKHELFIQFFDKHLLKILTISEITDQSINQVINLSSDIFATNTVEQESINNLEKLIKNPSGIDLLVFGTDDVLISFKLGQLKEIYVNNNFIDKEDILNHETKTNIIIIDSAGFVSKYGDLVGIKYYSPTTGRDDEYCE